MSTPSFNGLSMPVFTAFGWAGEETALNFALSQLEQFIRELHLSLPRSVQQELPVFGLSQESQGVYLATGDEVESDAHIAFYARPMSLELQLAVTNKEVLRKGLALAEKDPVNTHHLLTKMGPEWSLRIQQMLIEEQSGVVSHYQDLFKDSVSQLSQEAATELFNKATYLNSQEKWVTPVYFGARFNSEQVAAMGTAVVKVMSEQIQALMPILYILSGRDSRKSSKRTKKSRPRGAVQPKVAAVPELDSMAQDSFVYVAELKPLHIRRGFINMTPQHWDFFALSARMDTRQVSVYYEGVYDKKSAVWRLQPSNITRLVLGPAAHDWLEENFDSEERIQLKAIKLDNDEIQISLSSVD